MDAFIEIGLFISIALVCIVLFSEIYRILDTSVSNNKRNIKNKTNYLKGWFVFWLQK